MRGWMRLGLALMLAAGALAEAARADDPGGWTLRLGGAYDLRRDLHEYYLFSPAAGALKVPAGGWERKWREERLWLELSHDLLAGEHWRLTPGLRLGQAQGYFSASNNGLNFSEHWRTQPALLWGGFLEAELRQGPRQGAFLRLRYDLTRAEAEEDFEQVAGGGGGGGGERDARFRWSEDELLLALGWRLGAWRPWLGASRLDWRLQKWLRYHIAESGARGPADLALIRSLNSAESEYHYQNENLWGPAAGLEVDLGGGWALDLQARLVGHEQYSLALAWSF
jgi:hypothetical protein